MKGITRLAALAFVIGVVAASGVLLGAAFAKGAGPFEPAGGSANGATTQAVMDGPASAFTAATDPAIPFVGFISPTPANGTVTTNTAAQMDINITNASSLSEFKWNWNGTDYAFYDDSLVLTMDLDNVSALGENSTYFVDASMQGNSGTCSGATCPSYVPNGMYRGAYKFDGTDDYIRITNAPSLNMSQNMTIAMWANISVVQESDLLQKGYGAVTGGYTFWVGNLGGSNQINWGAQSTNNWVSTTALPATNRWVHIVGTYDGTNLSIYIDGKLNNSAAFSFSFVDTGDLVLGYGWDGYANSAIDEVRIWNRSMTAGEIRQQYLSNLNKYAADKWQFQTNQTDLTTGDYTYYGAARNSAGENKTETRTLSVDLTTPQIQFAALTEAAGAALGRNYIQVNVTASGSNIANITVYLYNSTALVSSATTTTSPNFANFTGLADITYFFNATAMNLVGNSNTTPTRNVTIDATPPTVTLNQPANGAGSLPQNITFNFTSVDVLNPPTNCTLYVDNVVSGSNSSVANNTRTGIAVTSIAEGSHNWNVTCRDSLNNLGSSSTQNFIVNVTPLLANASAAPNPIKGGNTIMITASGIDDPNNGTLNFYCTEGSTPNSSYTNCTGGTTTDTSPPYALSCTYAVASDDALHQANCRVYDGAYYSTVRTANFTTDSTPPVLTLANVAGDTAATYYDTANDGWTNITVNGEAGMSCRWSTSDLAYGSMTNDCDNAISSQARCGITTSTQGLNNNWYVSCTDSVGNSNTASNNLDVTGVVLDWTAPTTTDNSSSSVQLPGYMLAIIETDNLYGAASIVTKYCTSSVGCTPDTSIDNGGTITFSTRGQNALRYNSSDPAGNMQVIVNRSININQLPAFSSATDDATTITGGSTVHLTTTSSDADSQTLKLYVCNSTSASSSGCNAGTYCSNITAGSNPGCSWTSETDSANHNWYAFIYDSLDEGATTNFSGSYTTDSAPPTIAITSPINTTYAEASVAVDVTLGEGGGYAWYSLDGAASTAMSNDSTMHWMATLTGLTDGLHRLRIYANDSVGNTNTTLMSFSRDSSLLDTNPPTLTVTAPANGSYSLASTVLANISLSETGNFSWYSLDGGDNTTMDRINSMHFGAGLSGLAEGTHNITFHANDSSGNTGSSNVIIFFVDTTAPRYVAFGIDPSSPTDNASAVCYSRWTDVVGLATADIADNATGTNSNSSLSGTEAWANRTLTAAQLLPRGYNCSITVYDSAGRSNMTGSFTFTVTDATSPLVHSISYAPTDSDVLDPNMIINVTANVTDEGTLGIVLLEYRQSNASGWSSSAMGIVSGNLYSGSFSPDVANTWIFKITANDSAGNTNSSAETSISVELDGSWLVSPADMGTKSGGISTNVSAGNLIINNTADYNQTFTISSNWANTFFNATTISLGNGTAGVIAINATTSGSVRQDTVTLTVTALDGTASPASRAANFTLVSYSNGPYLYVTVSAPDSVTVGNTANLSATVKNIGNSSATGTTMAWSLPNGWTITSGSSTTSIGFLGINEQASASITVVISSSAATGTQAVTVQASSDQTSNSGSRNVVVSATGTTVQQTTIVAGGSASGGGGAAPMPTLSVTAPANAAVQIGTEDGFPVKITNTFDDNLANIRLEVSGFLSQYLSIEPATIALLKPGEVGQFIVKIKAPDYLSDQNFQLNITVRADRVTARGTTELTKSLTTGLLLLAVAPEQVGNSIAGAEQTIRDVEAAGLNAQKLQQLLADAQSAMAAKNYADADRLVKEIMRLKEVALGATAQLKTMEEKIAAVHTEGLSIPETERVVQLANEAMARGDFDRAAARLGSASLTFALETKGQVNVIALSLHWWWLIALGSLVTAMGAATAWRELTLWRIGRGLSNMRREERSINELMGQTQAAYYHGQSIPKVDFYKTMYGYEKRLAEVHADFSRLVTQRAKLINATDEAKRLDSEDAKLKRLIIELQKRYFEEGRMGKAAYERQMHELVKRRSELAEQHELVMKQGRQKMSGVARLAERTKGLYNRAAAAADRWVRGI
jgi:uncharacterized membrane protein